MSRPPDRERPPAGKPTTARKVTGCDENHDSRRMRHVVATTSCPLACSPSCSYRCPVALADVVPVVVAGLR